ncbi:hypothetical protein [Sorangium sp. So ce1182]|uniref:hypothetical protein n=1 Tax=Sorangium sp. So ce1182 TaxID=3133334 RepID=UPI003F62491A
MIWLFTGLVAATALVLCWRSLVRRSRFARAPAPRRPFFARNAESQADFLARQLGAGP